MFSLLDWFSIGWLQAFRDKFEACRSLCVAFHHDTNAMRMTLCVILWVLCVGAPLRTKAADGSVGSQLPSDGVEIPTGKRLSETKTLHWAFAPIREPTLPQVDDRSWTSGTIDYFVLARLESAGLTPSPRADRRSLIRRVFIDLIGLPPTYDQVESFVADDSPEAMARQIDQLLDQREYGERWARHWLDVARYADTKGYVDAGEQRFPFAYTYRDYVIRALNDDLPFDRFVLEQLAADQLVKDGETRPLAALGFLTVGSWYNLFPHEIIDDRIDVVTRGFMGLTINCARCHDHKYDPISTEDYYALYGVFASSREPAPGEYPLLAAAGVAEDEAFREKLKEAGMTYANRRAELHEKVMFEMRAWAGDYLRYVVQTMPEHRTQVQPPLRTERGAIREVSAYAHGGVSRWRRYLNSRNSDDPVFGLWNRLVMLSAEEIAADSSRVIAEIIASGVGNRLVLEAFTEKAPMSMPDVADIYGRLLEQIDAEWRKLLEDDPDIVGFEDQDREQLRHALYGVHAPGTVSLDESEDLYTLDESTDVRTKFSNIERVYLEAENQLAPRAMVIVDRLHPVEPRVFLRGDPEQPGDQVARRLPKLLSTIRSKPFAEGSGRLELANAIVHRTNPLTARVIVNRIWGWHFGRGLVTTASDFGVRSAMPSHPELLDHLAFWFMENGWSLKKLQRLILNSSAWQQASMDRPECRRVDVQNMLLWRMNRQRLDFETMRDSMLAVSGNLESYEGGPPIQEPPDDVSNTRRTLYSYIDRYRLPEIYGVFDFPNPDISASERSRTTTPQQTLFLLNSPFVIAQSAALSTQLDGKFKLEHIEDRIRWLYRTTYARQPVQEELVLAARFVSDRIAGSQHEEKTTSNPWLDLAQVLLQSNEFLFVD